MISEEKHVGDYTFVVVSDEGLGHALSKTPNQDAAMYEISDEDFAIAVSDGVGSCPKADIGAGCAVDAVRKVFYLLKAGRVEQSGKAVVTAIIEAWLAGLDGGNIDDYCATLKAAVKTGNRLLLLSIGDGLLAVTSNGVTKAAPMSEGQFANQTACLNKKVKYTDFWTSVFLPDTYMPYVVFICTDGVAYGIREGQELELVRELESNMDSLLLREELERFVIDISDYSADDRTVGMVKYGRKNAKSDW